ncbi:CAP domain-containing protein [Streptomyces sp. NBC_00378]|uniref:CAP domain-containing protein n=1 Tax=unclassified Streptomyces TaxID=2593676 RepID=UPI002253BD87|nr:MULTISPECIES: CAP domain-containing protein [unclassified Streptomyces]MCX5109056.1 CAP domain-containing protein [Streptomyces sp. NBC_00378]
MGSHRRSATAATADDHAAEGAGRSRGGHRRKRSAAPVRTGLVGVSAALAVGAVAVASGLVPGGDTYSLGGGSDRVRTEGSPDLLTQGGSSTAPADRSTASGPASRGTGRAGGPASAQSSAGSPSSAPKTSGPAERTEPSRSASAKTPSAGTGKSTAPAAEKSSAAPKTSAPATRSASAPADSSVPSAVLALVNQERSKVGCSPLTASSSLASLAQDFSEDMAARGFFDHTDPDGRSPWDRASKAGAQGLAAENIARGQATAKAVMDSWMNSPGHRANILNCDYRTLGVGVHYGSGGPWWTQDFGF